MNNHEQLPLITKYDCKDQYNSIIECIKLNSDKINMCDV